MKSYNVVTVVLFVLIGSVKLYAQTVRYVKPVATGTGSGTSWANASDDLQAMINASSSNDIIHVAAGTYKPNRRADNVSVITPNDRDNAFLITNSVHIYGGYPVSGPPVRDIVANPTILSGDIGVPNDSLDNCYHVVMRVGFPTNPILDGFTIRDGNANGTGSILVGGETILRENGGGVLNTNSNADANSNQEFDIINCTFINNTATNGGAIFNSGFFMTNCFLLDCNFFDNSAISGGAIYNGGFAQCAVKGDRCQFINNTATANGGALSNGDNGDLGHFTISNSTFIENNANNGGGVYNGAANPSISALNNCSFIGNAANDGSTVYTTGNVFPAELNILNSIIWGNTVTNGDLVNNGGTLNVSYSIVENGFPGTANSNLDPLFTDAANDDFSLQITSPAINMGDNITYGNGNLDLAGNDRIIGTDIDAGAYESPFGAITPDSAGIVYVNINVVGGNRNGHRWEDAVPQLADALVAAHSDTTITQIWVAQGTYYPLYTPETGLFFADQDRDNAFLVVENVKIYGGFQNANETNLNQRDTTNLNTVLSGERAGANCYHVVVSVGPVGTACIDGFTIRDGYASGSLSTPIISVDGYGVSKRNGGGVHMNESSPVIRNCAITDNFAMDGGGIYAFQTSYSISNCLISDNEGETGGGIYSHLSYPIIENSIIRNNEADEGGGLYTYAFISATTPYITDIRNSVIASNTATTGGGIYLKNRMNVLLTNCTVADNNGNGSIFSESNTYSSVEFRNTLLWDNASGFDPGLGTNTYSSFYSLIQDRNDFPANGNLDGTNMANDPLFADVLNGDFTLLSCSPAINLGSNAEYTFVGGNLTLDNDLAKNPRLYDGTIDMGAYELQTPPVSQIVPTFTQIGPTCSGVSFSLPAVSDNGISGVWTPAPNFTQTTTYSFVSTSGQCASTDTVNMTVTVNPLDDATFDYPVTSACVATDTISPSIIVTPGGTFDAPSGLSIDASTGEIDLSTSQVGTYTISYTTAQQCPTSSTINFTVNGLPDASFQYPNSSYCTSSTDPSPIITGAAGSFSATPAGLAINSATGAVDLSTSSAGVYEVTNLIAASGNCPADTVAVMLTVEMSPTAVISFAGGVLTANQVSGATYQWINCANQAPIQGETQLTYAPSTDGTYAVVVTVGNCSTTSACETVSFADLENLTTQTIIVYPNPSNGFLTISSPVVVDVALMAMDGKVIQSVKNAETIDLSSLANSIYLLRITDEDGTLLKMERVVVER